MYTYRPHSEEFLFFRMSLKITHTTRIVNDKTYLFSLFSENISLIKKENDSVSFLDTRSISRLLLTHCFQKKLFTIFVLEKFTVYNRNTSAKYQHIKYQDEN